MIYEADLLLARMNVTESLDGRGTLEASERYTQCGLRERNAEFVGSSNAGSSSDQELCH